VILKNEWLSEYWHYRELFYFFIWRDVKIRYRQTVLGATWAVIQPFFTMVVFTIFFGKLANVPSDGIPYPIFSFSALVPWTFFSAALSMSGNSLISNSHLLTKVYFPRVALPVSSVLSGLVDFFIASLFLFGMMAYYHVQPGWRLLLWPVLTIPLILLALGMGMILSSLNARYRDIKYAIPFFIQLWLFITPIIYPVSIIPEKFRGLIALNPLSGIIEAFRFAVLPSRHLDVQFLLISMAVTVLIFIIGLIYFQKAERMIADII
jgi:homopolymeric O-antigen transport system permease protein